MARELGLAYAALCTLDNYAHGVRDRPVDQSRHPGQRQPQRQRLPGGAGPRAAEAGGVSTLLIRDVRIVDARQDRQGDVLVENGLIAEVGPARATARRWPTRSSTGAGGR